MLALPEVVRYRDLADLGVTRYQFEDLLNDGHYERFAPGAFIKSGAVDDTTGTWMAIAAKKSHTTLCLLTAASLHDLTDEIPTETHLAIPRGSQVVSVSMAPTRWHRFAADTFDIGRQAFPLPGGLSIGLYSPERTIVDLFRLRHLWGMDLAVGALKRWLREPGNNASSLLDMASTFPKGAPALKNALEILL